MQHAALECNIPKSTLGDRISGRILTGAKSGPAKHSSVSEEEGFVLRCAFIGYPRSRREV